MDTGMSRGGQHRVLKAGIVRVASWQTKAKKSGVPVVLDCPTEHHYRSCQITTMQQHSGSPFPARMLQRIMLASTLFFSIAWTANATSPSRVASLNMCTDQLLLDLADPRQIAGLSPFATDATRSFMAEKAKGLPALSGTAEEIMVLKPDLVVAGTFTKRATREFIRGQGVKLEEFAPVQTLAENRQQITRFGQITGAVDKAAGRNAELDAALLELRAAASKDKLRVLPLSRRGWVAGSNTLISEILTQSGLINAADDLGLRSDGRTTLEAIVMLRPDAILIAQDDDNAEDQGKALLLHPAIQRLFPPERRIIIPERLTICGGPMLVEAMQMLSRQINQLKPRHADPR
jgi:iron complex transport system substrate-binding protein